MKISACFTSKSDQYATPSYIYDQFMKNGWFDPCPLNVCPEWDGLKRRWFKFNYVNPPYSHIKEWVSKSISEVFTNNCVVVLLVPARTDTQWFRSLIRHGCHVVFITGRLRFNDGNPAPFPSCFVRLSPRKRVTTFDFVDHEDIDIGLLGL